MSTTSGIKRGWLWLTPAAIALLAAAACGSSPKPTETVVAKAPPAIAHPVSPDAIDRVKSPVGASLPGAADAFEQKSAAAAHVVAKAPPAFDHPVTPDAIDRVKPPVGASLPGSADAAEAWAADIAAASQWANFRG